MLGMAGFCSNCSYSIVYSAWNFWKKIVEKVWVLSNFCSNILSAKQDFCFAHYGCEVRLLCKYMGCKLRHLVKHFWCKASVLFKNLGQSKTFVQTFGVWCEPFFKHFRCRTRLLFKHFWCIARLLFKHFGCKARLLFKLLGEKQDFCSQTLAAK